MQRYSGHLVTMLAADTHHMRLELWCGTHMQSGLERG
jgi:hypothetical protein